MLIFCTIVQHYAQLLYNPMNTDFGSLIRKKNYTKKITQKNLSINKFKDISNISRRALHNLLDNHVTETKFSTLTKLAIALDIPPKELFNTYFQSLNFSHEANLPKHHQTLLAADDISFISDVTIPQGSTVSVSTLFDKTWRIKNSGQTHWQNRSLICLDQLLEVRTMDGKRVTHGLKSARKKYPIPDTAPGEEIELTITFLAPRYPCTVVSCWDIVNVDGKKCFPSEEPLSCMVRVISL